MEIVEDKKKKFCFKEYYNSNPEFKKRHLAKLAEKVLCSCGKTCSKGRYAKHLMTTLHLNAVKSSDEVKPRTINDLVKEIEILKNKVDQFEKKI